MNLVQHRSLVSAAERQDRFQQHPFTFWLTGLSAAGKSTIAYAFERALFDQGKFCIVLDGDNVRHGLSQNLGFLPEERTENIRRVAEAAKLMNQAGLMVIAALISPLRADREMARNIIGPEHFREIHIATPLAVCETRDPKGFYAKARHGGLPGYTGVAAPYESPESPDLAIDTANQSVEDAVAALRALIPQYSAPDESHRS